MQKLQLAIIEDNSNIKSLNGEISVHKVCGENLLYFANLHISEEKMQEIYDFVGSISAENNVEIYLKKMEEKYDTTIARMFLMDLFNNKSYFKKKKNTPVAALICENINGIACMAWMMLKSYINYIQHKSPEDPKHAGAFLSLSIFFDETLLCKLGHQRIFKFIEDSNGIYKLSSLCIFNSALQVFLMELQSLLNNSITIKKCENCKQYFIPMVRSDEIYCDNIFRNNKTCKQLGYEQKINSNLALKEYRRKYKAKNAFKNRNLSNKPQIQQEFDEWHQQAKVKLFEVETGVLSENEFLKWLDMEGICDGKHNKEE